MTIKLGDKAKDTITGLTGTVIARYEFLNGCVQLRIQPNEVKDGKPVEGSTFDIEQMELVKAATAPRKLAAVGGPHDEPAARGAPSR
jgi:hypothetical protein